MIGLRNSFRILLVAGLVTFSACSSVAEPDDQQIVKDIQSQLFSHRQLKNRDISVVSSEGIVTLSGTVEDRSERLQVGEIARQAKGVKQVTDMLSLAAPQPPEEEPVAAAPVRRAPPPRLPPPVAAPAPKPVARPAPLEAAPAAPTPTREPPARRAPRPPRLVSVGVPAGTIIQVRMIDNIDPTRHSAGEEFAASVDSALVVDGRIIAPRGTDATVRLIEARTSGRFKGRSELRIELIAVYIEGREYPVETTDYLHQGGSRGKNTATRVGAGAAIGSVIGAIAGGGKGAAIGGAIGAGGGTAAQAATKGKQVQLPTETRIDFVLRVPFTATIQDRR